MTVPFGSKLIKRPSPQSRRAALRLASEHERRASDVGSDLLEHLRPLGEWPEMVCAENPNEYFHGRRAAVPTADKPDF